MRALSAAMRLALFFCLTIVAMFVQSIALILRLTFARTLPHYFFRAVAILLGMKVIVEGNPPTFPGLIVANHVSWLDIVAISAVVPVVFVAKREVAGWPLFGPLAKLGQTMFIDRQRRRDTGRVRDRMVEHLAAGRLVVLFPEGTSSDGNRVLPFRSALLGAIETTVSSRHIFPLTLAYVGQHGLPLARFLRPRFAWYGEMGLIQHLWGVAKCGAFEVTLRFNEHLTIEDGASRKAIARIAEERVRAGLQSLLTGREKSPVFTITDMR